MSEKNQEDFTLATRQSQVRAQRDMSPADRIRMLTQETGEAPSRELHFDDEQDPFGLLDHSDTYEAFAGLVFTQCEGVYKVLANNRPEVIQQLKAQEKQADKNIRFPSVTLSELYQFRMTRMTSGENTTYFFQRDDIKYESKGFSVMKTHGDHFVLRNIESGIVDLEEDDKTYHMLLRKAEAWVQDYAAALNIEPTELRTFATRDISPHTLSAQIGRKVQQLLNKTGNNAQKLTSNMLIKNAAKAMYTKQVEKVDESADRYGRRVVNARREVTRPRWVGIMATLAILPTSLSPTPHFVGEDVALDAFGVGAVAATIPGHIIFHTAHRRETFDNKHLSLPADAAVFTVKNGAREDIPYVTDLDSTVASKAPEWSGGQDGNIKTGSIRRLEDVANAPGNNYAIGLGGLKAGACTPDAFAPDGGGGFHTNTKVDVVNTDPTVANKVGIYSDSNYLRVCNISRDTIPEVDLQDIYAEFYPAP